MHHRWITFTGEALAWDLQVGRVARVLDVPMDGHRPWVEALDQVAVHGSDLPPLAAARVEGVLLQVFAALLDAAGASSAVRSDAAVERALAWLDRHYLRHPSLAEVAQVAGRSRSHLQERFTATVGCSPTAYARLRRLQEAQHLLQGTTLPVQEVARRCGYADPLHFSRVLRRHCGCSPRRLRDLAQG